MGGGDVGRTSTAVGSGHGARDVALSKVKDGRLPVSHLTYDQNTFITVDPADASLVATGKRGAPSTGSRRGRWRSSSSTGSIPLRVGRHG